MYAKSELERCPPPGSASRLPAGASRRRRAAFRAGQERRGAAGIAPDPFLFIQKGQKKILVIFLLLGAGLAMGTYAILGLFVFPAFGDFENEQSGTSLSLVEQVIEFQMQSLKIFVTEYAHWDETYAYIQEPESYPNFVDQER